MARIGINPGRAWVINMERKTNKQKPLRIKKKKTTGKVEPGRPVKTTFPSRGPASNGPSKKASRLNNGSTVDPSWKGDFWVSKGAQPMGTRWFSQ